MTKRGDSSDRPMGRETLVRKGPEKETLRSHKIQVVDLPDLTARELVDIRLGLKMSRAVFARYLHTNARTLEGWEQGRARPNAQAVTLIRLVKKHPETVGYLAALT